MSASGGGSPEAPSLSPAPASSAHSSSSAMPPSGNPGSLHLSDQPPEAYPAHDGTFGVSAINTVVNQIGILVVAAVCAADSSVYDLAQYSTVFS